MNPMEEVIIDKVVVNIGVGQAGDSLTKASKVLEMLTGHKATNTLAKKSIRDFNIRKRLPIGVKVTLRKKDAMEFLQKAFYVKDYKITDYSFDKHGNAYFGISDYTDFKGMKYDPDIGIFGMDVAIVFRRRGGYRIERRRIGSKTIPNSIRVRKEEAQDFLQKNFKVTVVR